MSRRGFVYCLMDTSRNICKIGLTEDIKTRMRGLKNSSSCPDELVHQQSRVEDMSEAENYMHRVFCKRRIHGEWFKDVTFQDFWVEINKYNALRKKKARDTAGFYKALYQTDFEIEKGIPERITNLINKPEYTIMIFKDREFSDVKLMHIKLNSILSQLPQRSQITLTCPSEHIKDKLHYYAIHNRLCLRSFHRSYDRDVKFTDKCIDQLNDCFGLVVFCKTETPFITRLCNHAKSEGIKFRLIKPQAIIRNLKIA